MPRTKTTHLSSEIDVADPKDYTHMTPESAGQGLATSSLPSPSQCQHGPSPAAQTQGTGQKQRQLHNVLWQTRKEREVRGKVTSF